MNATIAKIESYLPARQISNSFIEDGLSKLGFNLPPNILQKTMGVENRYYASEEENVSDLAVKAAKKIFDSETNSEDINLLIYASACSDLIEPATCNIVHEKLQLNCPAFDVKNACNSILNAIDIASLYIKNNQYQNVLIVSGEKPSDSINFHPNSEQELKDCFASYSFGDAGLAILMKKTTTNRGLLYSKQQTYGNYWELCQIPGGGSMFPHDASKLYFTGKTYELKNVFEKVGPDFLGNCLKESKISLEEIDWMCTHQVSKDTHRNVSESSSFPEDKIIKTFHLYGNTASVSLPLSFEYGLKNGHIKDGDLVLLLGMAAGINLSFQLIRV